MGAQAVRLSNVDIDNALKNKDFEVLFQPIFDLGNGALARVETFVRWRHPSLGVLPPGAFISFFESQGRMSELTRYVLAEALSNYTEWRGPYAPGFSINLALSDLSDSTFASHFEVLTRESEFPAELVTLECPMPPVDVETDAAAEQFQRLAQTGARLAIEVRGRANDFLREVDPFPFAEIKTGGAAILRFARTVRGPGLSAISELLELAKSSNAAITAVGVEDQASLSALRGLGFAAAQGNHLGRVGKLNEFSPSRVNEVRALLELEPLSKEDLSALFRTEGPLPAKKSKDAETGGGGDADETAEKSPAVAAPPSQAKPQKSDDLVERLAARIAKTEDDIDTEKSTDPSTETNRAEQKRKAAAIARAKKKMARKAEIEAAASQDKVPAHDLQKRLSEEFEFLSEYKAPQQHSEDKPVSAGSRAEKAAASTSPASEHDLTPTAPTTAKTPLDAGETTTETGSSDPAVSEAEPALSTKGEVSKADEKTSPAPDISPISAIATAPEPEDDAADAQSPSEETISAQRNEEPDEIGVADQAASLDAFEPSDKMQNLSLNIPDPVARFRPGVRVGGPVVGNIAPIEVSASDLEPAPEASAGKQSSTNIEKDQATQEIASQQTDRQIQDGLEEIDSPAETAWIGEAAAVADADATTRADNFLTRKYMWPIRLWRTIFWPTHFWPRSWRRAWDRRVAAKEAKDEVSGDETGAYAETPENFGKADKNTP